MPIVSTRPLPYKIVIRRGLRLRFLLRLGVLFLRRRHVLGKDPQRDLRGQPRFIIHTAAMTTTTALRHKPTDRLTRERSANTYPTPLRHPDPILPLPTTTIRKRNTATDAVVGPRTHQTITIQNQRKGGKTVPHSTAATPKSPQETKSSKTRHRHIT